jgi:hypothetical protein
MHTTQERGPSHLRRSQWIAKTRLGLRMPPSVPIESYLWVYALVGVLGGIGAAVAWLMLAPGP